VQAHRNRARFDFGEIEHLVDHFKQMLSAGKNGFEFLAVIFCLTGTAQQKLSITKDAV